MEAFLYASVALLALLGLAYAVRLITKLILGIGKKTKLIHILCVRDGNPEMQVRSAVEQIGWNGIGANNLVVVACGLDDENQILCEKICSDYGIEICRCDEMQKIICKKVNEDGGRYHSRNS